MAYTEQEKKEFRAKDERISRQGLVQSIIQSGYFTKEEVLDGQILFELVEKYRNYVCNGLGTENKSGDVDWEALAGGSGLPIPTLKQIDILEEIMDGVNGKVTPVEIMTQIINKHETYPTLKSSVKTVLDELM